MTIENLPDKLLIDSYIQAKKMGLEPTFVEVLYKEIEKRALEEELDRESDCSI